MSTQLISLDFLNQLPFHQRQFAEVGIWFLVPLALIVVSLLGIKRKKMDSGEEFSHIWFIFNGSIIHLFLDGLIGGLKYCPPLANVYGLIDLR